MKWCYIVAIFLVLFGCQDKDASKEEKLVNLIEIRDGVYIENATPKQEKPKLTLAECLEIWINDPHGCKGKRSKHHWDIIADSLKPEANQQRIIEILGEPGKILPDQNGNIDFVYFIGGACDNEGKNPDDMDKCFAWLSFNEKIKMVEFGNADYCS
ncbi:MAG: hypothetical protein AAF693_12775 [Bacteroidota bacterium]